MSEFLDKPGLVRFWQHTKKYIDDKSAGGGESVAAASNVSFDSDATDLTADTVQGAIEELFTSVSDGKKQLASAITDKGVPTDEDASFFDMAVNISSIPQNAVPDGMHSLTLNVNPIGSGTVEGDGVASDNMTVTAIAHPNTGFDFDYWTENKTIVSKNANYSFLSKSNRLLTANFSDNFVVDVNNWGISELPVTQGWKCIAYGNGRFVALAAYSAVAAYSDDGINWNAATAPNELDFCRVVYGGDKFVAICDNEKSYAYSYDGEMWITSNFPTVSIYKIAYGGGKFVAIPYENTKSYHYSEDGINWSTGEFPTDIGDTVIAYGADKFVVPCGNAPKVYYSYDGISWETTEAADYNPWSTITFGRDGFVAICSQYILKSQNGSSEWTFQQSNMGGSFYGSAYGGGKYITFPTPQGTNKNERFLFSKDTIEWISGSLPLAEKWSDVTYGQHKFVAIAGRDANGASNKVAYTITED